MHAWTLFYLLQFIYVAVALCLTKVQRQTLKLGGGEIKKSERQVS